MVERTRKRVAQACQRCRQRKFKCDGQRPECATCTQANEPCCYEAHLRRRGLQEGYVRGLELLAGLAIRHVDNFEDRLLSRLLEKNERQQFTWLSDFDNLVDAWKRSQLSTKLERLLPSLPSLKSLALKRKFDENSDEHGDGSRQPSASIARSTPQSTTPGQGRISQGCSGTAQSSAVSQEPLLPDQLLCEGTLSTRPGPLSGPSPAETQLPAHLNNLLKLYFFQTHCWYPIVDKPEVMRLSYRFVNENASDEPRCGSFALLWAMVASASHGLLHSGHTIEGFDAANVSESRVSSYYSRARDLIPCEEGPFDLHHAQALLLLSLIKIQQSLYSVARFLIAKAAHVIIDLKPAWGTSESHPHAMARHKRTYLGCFVLDILVSFHLGQPPSLQEPNACGVGNMEEEGLDEWDLWSNPFSAGPLLPSHCFPMFTPSTFNHLVRVCTIIQRKLLASLYGQRLPVDTVVEPEKDQSKEPWTTIFNDPTMEDPAETRLLPHHFHLRLIHLIAVSGIGSPLDPATKKVSYPVTKGAPSVAEAVALIHEFKNQFGPHAVPQTSSLIVDILSKKQTIATTNLSNHLPQSLTYQYFPTRDLREMTQDISCSQPPRESSPKQSRILRSSRIEKPPLHMDTGHCSINEHHHGPTMDSDSVFNELLAIDACQWSDQWEESLLNLGFTADSSIDDVYDFCEPSA